MTSINRREALKLGCAGSLAAIAPAFPAVAEPQTPVPRWEVFELNLSGTSAGNPFVEVQLQATFALGHRQISVDGFYDGAGSYKVRFMPDTEGHWTYTTSSNAG